MPEPERHIETTEPGEKVQLDCFYVGRLSGTKGTVWQYAAIDVASAYAWAELRTSQRTPPATPASCSRVARKLKAAGWKLDEVTGDNGSEFRSKEFGQAVEALGACQRFIKAGRPNSNGCVERLQPPSSRNAGEPPSRSLVPKMTALQRHLDEYLHTYNSDRAHTGRLTKVACPPIVFGARKSRPVR